MNKNLSIDEFNALEQISQLTRGAKPSICINRNAKRLCGIKFATYRKDGQLELTQEGRAVLHSKHCLDALRRIAANSSAPISVEIKTFLLKKSYLQQDADNTLSITARGLECLADVDARNVDSRQ